jgi:hypothetical protein
MKISCPGVSNIGHNRIVFMIHKVKDLSAEQKATLERLVGRTITDQEDVSVRVLEAPPKVSAARRQEILDGLKAFFARVDARCKPVSAEEADEIIDEALRSTRPGYRPHH